MAGTGDLVRHLVEDILEVCDEFSDMHPGASNLDQMAALTIALAHVIVLSRTRDGQDQIKCAQDTLATAIMKLQVAQ